MEEQEYMIAVVDPLNRLLLQMENAAATAWLAKEGAVNSCAESAITVKTMDFFSQVLYQMADELKKIINLIAEKENIDI